MNINKILEITQSRESLRLLLNDELTKINGNFVDLNNNKIESITITPGNGIDVTGTGTVEDPFVIVFGNITAPFIDVLPIEGSTSTNLQDSLAELHIKVANLEEYIP